VLSTVSECGSTEQEHNLSEENLKLYLE